MILNPETASLQFSFQEYDEASFNVSDDNPKGTIGQIFKRARDKTHTFLYKQSPQAFKVISVRKELPVEFSFELMRNTYTKPVIPIKRYILHDGTNSSLARKFSFGTDSSSKSEILEQDSVATDTESVYMTPESESFGEQKHTTELERDRGSPEPEYFKKHNYQVPLSLPKALYHQVNFSPMIRKKVIFRSDSGVKAILDARRSVPQLNNNVTRNESTYSCDTKVGSSILSYDAEYGMTNRVTSLITKFEQMSQKLT